MDKTKLQKKLFSLGSFASKDRIKLLFIFFFNLANICIFWFAVRNLNTIEYYLFTIISLIYINYTLINYKYYSELFFSFFVYLGFWFKFSLHIFYQTNKLIFEANSILYYIAEENFFSNVLNTVSLAILAIFLSFFFIKKTNFLKNKLNIKFDSFTYLVKYYKLKLLFTLLIFFFTIILSNLIFNISYLGQINKIFLLEKIYKVLMIIYIPLIICFFAHIYNNVWKKKLITLICIIVLFSLLSLSLNSRAILIFLIPIMIVYYNLLVRKKIIILMFFFTFIIFLLTNSLLFKRYNNDFINNLSLVLYEEIPYLLKNRWVGISGMINVEYSKNKNFKLFKETFKNPTIPTFYEKNFFYSQDPNEQNYLSIQEENLSNKKLVSKIVPGFMAFFYFSGSKTFLTFSIFLIVCLMIFAERFCKTIMNKNHLFIATFSYILVWRVIHMGLNPINSILFYFILLSAIPFLYFSNKCLKKVMGC